MQGPIRKLCLQAIAVTLVLLALPGCFDMGRRPPNARGQCKNQLRGIGLALHAYHDRHGSLPPATVTDAATGHEHSWRVLLLPYLEKRDVYKKYRFNEPWDSPHNRKLADDVSILFRCPARTPPQPGMTNYLAVVGPGSVWDTGAPNAEFGSAKDARVVLVETSSDEVGCFEPRDFDLSAVDTRSGTMGDTLISSEHVAPQVGLLNGEVRMIPPEVRMIDFMKLVTGP